MARRDIDGPKPIPVPPGPGLAESLAAAADVLDAVLDRSELPEVLDATLATLRDWVEARNQQQKHAATFLVLSGRLAELLKDGLE